MARSATRTPFADLGARLVSEATSYKPLALLRIGASAILLIQGILLWDYRELLLGEHGLVPWTLGEAFIDPLMPRLSTVARALAPLGFSAAQALMVVLAVHLLAAAFLLIGWRTRIAAFVAWITHLVLIGTGSAYTYGLGKMLVIALFYCLVMPVGRQWSVDRRRIANLRPPTSDLIGEDATFAIVVLRIHLCIIYAAAGFSKAMGEQWWTGDAVYRALSLPQFSMFDTTGLGAFPLVLQAAAIGSVVVQLLYPVLVWTRARFAIVVAAELLHLGIAFFLGLWLFSAVMMVLNAAAFGQSLWTTVRRRVDVPRGHASNVTIVYDGACPFCSDYVRYQELRRAAQTVDLVDARSDADALRRYGIEEASLEDGMVVIVDGARHFGGDAVHALSLLSQPPRHWWVAGIAALTTSRAVSRFLYPFLKAGRRVALTFLRVPRFSTKRPG
jgi:predicted DCC family thiol-disulfide oxidoreductase YuxK/uncharacterized membrane protein YphA (DoxX/SURF4 family)